MAGRVRPYVGRLDGFGFGVSGGGDVGGRVVERLAGLEGDFFVAGAYFPDGVVPAVVPGDTGFVIH